ncbi:MAG: hypothetical protein JSV03_17265 [Planctomycetota bacterium]|nr:MAG: hypothetical protein JSV03_17265 [Planctomycetota bacterium]
MNRIVDLPLFSRRQLLCASLAGTCTAVARAAALRKSPTEKKLPLKTYATQIKNVRIHPGAWRPHYPWEHIAWVSPPWPSQDYVWLDFPEAIFTKQGLLYLSHINPKYPVVFPKPPVVKWQTLPNGVTYERKLPNGIVFGGKITKDDNAANLELFIRNGSNQPIEDIKLQTCAFLRAIKEFGEYTADSKYVHVPQRGWLPFKEAKRIQNEPGKYRLGWRSGPAIADRPIMATLSSTAQRLTAFTWLADTYSLTTNPNHPCMHADPAFPNLPPGKSATIHGKLLFFEGSLNDFSFA